jgi:alkanesulfonate monooxygenase SsuD/methylene tetrahydromethanopterin reductase-like flavin-dependent oxidoreductase (luciferase family)
MHNDDLIIGVSINNVTGITGKAYDLSDLVRAAVEAEAMGFDAVWVHDAMMGRRTTAAYCPVTTLAAIAGRTSRIRLCTGILTPQVRNPVQLANQWATLYELSDQRAIMGVGMGAGTPTLIKREFEGLAVLKHGTDLNPAELYAKRGKVFDECLDVMRQLWATTRSVIRANSFASTKSHWATRGRNPCPPYSLHPASISPPNRAAPCITAGNPASPGTGCPVT